MFYIYVVILTKEGTRWVHIPDNAGIDKTLLQWRSSENFLAQVYSRKPEESISEELEKIYQGILPLCSQNID